MMDGCMYLVEEERLGASIDLFIEVVRDKDDRGLIITRMALENVGLPDDMSNYPQYRLAQNYHDPTIISPHRIPDLCQLILNFCDMRRPGVILFEGLEYMMGQNSFTTLLNLIQFLGDHISSSRCIILLSINPLAFKLKDLHLLKRETYRLPETLLSGTVEDGFVEARTSKAGP